MAGDLPPGPTDGLAVGRHSTTRWTPGFPIQALRRPRIWPAVALAAVANVVATAALIVALTRPTAAKPTATITPSTLSAVETSAAERRLCDTYKL